MRGLRESNQAAERGHICGRRERRRGVLKEGRGGRACSNMLEQGTQQASHASVQCCSGLNQASRGDK